MVFGGLMPMEAPVAEDSRDMGKLSLRLLISVRFCDFAVMCKRCPPITAPSYSRGPKKRRGASSCSHASDGGLEHAVHSYHTLFASELVGEAVGRIPRAEVS